MKIKTLCAAVMMVPGWLHAQETVPTVRSDIAAEVTLITGSVTASTPAETRTLSRGDTVYVGEAVLTGANSYANLKFADGGRVLLRPNTDFTVEAYRYLPTTTTTESIAPAAEKVTGSPAPNQQAFFRLLRGGFRAVSGLIGKVNPQAYRVTTAVATIGIRGTDYEVQTCDLDCPEHLAVSTAEDIYLASRSMSGLELAQADGSNSANSSGLVLATNDGTVMLQTGRGNYAIKTGQVALALSNGQLFMLPSVPDLLLNNPTPSPEDCD